MYFIESYLKTSACTLKYFDTFFFANLVFSLRNTRMRASSAISSHPLVSISASTPFTPLCPRPRHVLYPSLASRCYFINDPLLFSISLSHFSTPFFYFFLNPTSLFPSPAAASLAVSFAQRSQQGSEPLSSITGTKSVHFLHSHPLSQNLPFLFSLLSFFLLLPARLVPWGPVNQAILPVQCLLTLNTADGGLLTD